jgi:adenylate cyclase
MTGGASKILVVDDEPDLEALILQKFRRQIRDGQMSFRFARDGVEALGLLADARDIDMVVSDINMPRMDGLSLLAKLQEAEEKLCTVVVSAYGDSVNIRTAMNRGAFDFLIKPVDLADLEVTIAKTIKHVTVQRESRRRQAEAERAYSSLSRYFSPNLVAKLAMPGGDVDLRGQRRQVAVVFTDIGGFTALVETLGPDVLSPLLDDYITGMTGVVFAHEGTVAKIVGDAVHVLFGAPGHQPDHAARALMCALELDRFAQDFRKRWKEKGISVGATRIGVHHGPAVVGNFGGGGFFDYTAYGDTINTAARLETANKQLGTRICASADIAERVPNFMGRPIGDLVLRGRSEPLRAFEPLTPEAHADPATRSYVEAFAKLQARDPGAMPAFAALVGMNPNDHLAGFHLRRLLNGGSGTSITLE